MVEAVVVIVLAIAVLGLEVWRVVQCRPKEAVKPLFDADDIDVLLERDGNGNLTHKLCTFCAGWHVPPVTAAGCPRLKAGDIDKHQTVTHFEYWENWNRENTIFPHQIDFPVESA